MEAGELASVEAVAISSLPSDLLDMGLIELKVDMKKRTKTWARATPKEPPCKTPMPRIDFLATKLKWD